MRVCTTQIKEAAATGVLGLSACAGFKTREKEQKFSLIRRVDSSELDFGRLSVALTSAA